MTKLDKAMNAVVVFSFIENTSKDIDLANVLIHFTEPCFKQPDSNCLGFVGQSRTLTLNFDTKTVFSLQNHNSVSTSVYGSVLSCDRLISRWVERT